MMSIFAHYAHIWSAPPQVPFTLIPTIIVAWLRGDLPAMWEGDNKVNFGHFSLFPFELILMRDSGWFCAFRRLDQLWRMCSSGKYDWHKLHSCLGSKYLVYTHFGQPVVERPTTTGLKISKGFAENALAFTQFLSSLAELFCQAVNYSYVNPRETDPKSKPQWKAECAKRTAFHQNGGFPKRLSPKMVYIKPFLQRITNWLRSHRL